MHNPSKRANFLVEIHTEELPPKALLPLAEHFLREIKTRLTQAELIFAEAKYYASPRRLAVSVTELSYQQPKRTIERKGPALTSAYDAKGSPTQACLGFARSCGIDIRQLIILKTAQGEWVGFRQVLAGKNVLELLPEIVEQALAALPVPKRMRWNSGTVEFVRPVHSIIMLYGNKKIPGHILGLPINNKTRGHRFLSKGWVALRHAEDYLQTLEQHFVIADFAKRKAMIQEQGNQLLKQQLPNATVMMKEELLNEVTGLVEWPVAMLGQFDKNFLTVPQEALISAMQDHQRYFPVTDQQGNLLPYFIVISNIVSQHPTQVVQGNERVLRARLSDAAFFVAVDKKQKLADHINTLKNIVFQHKLGTLFDKAKRLSLLTTRIITQMDKTLNTDVVSQAGWLAKTDLCTQLVSEFPELQGIAGRYYALQEGLPIEVATAIYEHYLPKFSGDHLPETRLGQALAIADRIDTLVGIFGIGQPPTGDKDPFALRRAALGLSRIIIKKQIHIDLKALLIIAQEYYGPHLNNNDTVSAVLHFIFERLKTGYAEKGITSDVFSAVATLPIYDLYDFHLRILAVNAFKKLPQAEALSIANKRVSNILGQYPTKIQTTQVNASLFEIDAEKQLAAALIEQKNKIQETNHYSEILQRLAELRGPVDIFFDKVLVMTDDLPRRENRLLLLKQLRELFLQVADIAFLQ